MRFEVREDAGVQQVDAGGARLVGQVDEAHPVDERFGDVFEDAGHQVGVGVDDDDGVRVPASGLLPHLVRDEVVHEGGLAHAGAGDVEVVAAEQVLGEADLPLRSCGGVSHQRAAPGAPGRGAERPCAGALHQGRLVAGSGRVPQGGDLADSQDAPLAEQAGACRVERLGIGNDGPHAAHLEAGARGVVVVAIGGGHGAEKLPGPLLPSVGWHDDDLELGVEGDAGDLLAYQVGSSTRLRAFFQRCHAQPPTARPRAMPVPRSAAFHISPSCTHRYPLRAARAPMPRTAIVMPSICRGLV